MITNHIRKIILILIQKNTAAKYQKANTAGIIMTITAEMIKDIVRIKKIMKQWKELYIEMTVRQAKT